MGQTISNLWSHFLGREDVRILLVGLDGAGKTTILYRWKLGEAISPIPTVGFNMETVEFKNIRFTAFDVGGSKQLWHHYFEDTEAIIFVIDSSDADRLCEAAEELHLMMERTELCQSVLLVLANKQDMPNALSITEIEQLLNLHKINQDWHVHGTTAISGNGLYDGLEKLREMLNKRKK